MKNLKKYRTHVINNKEEESLYIETLIRDFLSDNKHSYMIFIRKSERLSSTFLKNIQDEILKQYPLKKILFFKSEWMIGEVFHALKSNSFKEYLMKLNETDIMLIHQIDKIKADKNMEEVSLSMLLGFLENDRKLIVTSGNNERLIIGVEKGLVIDLDSKK